MRAGVVLPTFAEDATAALAVARGAADAGVDGVFCYDHLWPMGQPERPALAPFPVLAALAATTEHLVLGTLVARVGLVPDEVLVKEFVTLDALAPGRVVAGLGTGDRLSRAENEAYGVPYPPAAERERALLRCARALLDAGIEVWAGGRAAAAVCRGADPPVPVVLNLWGAPADEVAAAAPGGAVTWAGPCPAPTDGLAPLLGALGAAGARWAVVAHPVDPAALAAAAHGAGTP